MPDDAAKSRIDIVENESVMQTVNLGSFPKEQRREQSVKNGELEEQSLAGKVGSI